MQFNVNKCSIMSVGKGNRPIDYTLNDNTLGRSYSVRDLGGLSSDLRPREQCIIARNRANKILGFISGCVTNRSSEVILRLYLVSASWTPPRLCRGLDL